MAYIVMGMMYEPDTYFEGKMEAQVSIFRYIFRHKSEKKGPGIFDAVFQKMQIWSLFKLEIGSIVEPFCLALVENKTGFALTSFQLIWKMG